MSQVDSIASEEPNKKISSTVNFEHELELQVKYEDYMKQEAKRYELRALNRPEAVVSTRKDISCGAIKLKSDLKKSSAFVKKLKTINETSGPILLKDINELNLTRYIDECVAAVMELNFKLNEIELVTQIVSLLHQKYEEFSEHLVPSLVSVISDTHNDINIKKLDPKTLMSKKRIALKLLCDLYLVGVHDNIQSIVRLVRYICNTSSDAKSGKKSSLDIPLLVSFSKYAGHHFLGIPLPKDRAFLDHVVAMMKSSIEAAKYQYVSNEAQEQLVEAVEKTFQYVSKMYINEYNNMKKKEKRNDKEMLNRGEATEANTKDLSDSKKLFEKLQSSINSLADALNVNVPPLPEEEKEEKVDGVLSLWDGGDRVETDSSSGPFMDEETRSFYEDLPDLLDTVPVIVLGLSEAEITSLRQGVVALVEETTTTTTTTAAGDENEYDLKDLERDLDESLDASEDQKDGLLKQELDDDNDDDDNDDKEKEKEQGKGDVMEAAMSSILDTHGESADDTTAGHKFMSFLDSLQNMVNRDRCDQAALDFCYLNSKGNRNRLVRKLYDVPRTHLELLPYYARFVAILAHVLKDIGMSLTKLLVEEFFYLQRAKSQHRLESKVRNVRFLGELTKFKVAPPIHIFRVLRHCLANFVGHNIEVTATIFETCGKFLYCTAHTNAKCKHYLEVMMRLKKAKSLDNHYSTLLDNAFYCCLPVEKRKVHCKVYDPMYLYMMELLYVTLHEKNVDKIVMKLRKFPWNNVEKGPLVRQWFIKSVLKVTNGRFIQMHWISQVCSLLMRFQDGVLHDLIDSLVEKLMLGLEQNDVGERQVMLGYIKLLGEFFHQGLVNAVLLYEVLYLLINHGHGLKAYYDAVGYVMSPEQLEYLMHIPDFQFDPRVPHPRDDVDDTFRIRLICCLLETCGSQLSTVGPRRVKLKRFLAFFQRYTHCKVDIPMELEFKIVDLLEDLSTTAKSHDQFQRVKSWEEAEEEVQTYLREEVAQFTERWAAAASAKAAATSATATVSRDESVFHSLVKPESAKENGGGGGEEDEEDDQDDTIDDDQEEEEDENDEDEEEDDENDENDEDDEDEDDEDEEGKKKLSHHPLEVDDPIREGSEGDDKNGVGEDEEEDEDLDDSEDDDDDDDEKKEEEEEEEERVIVRDRLLNQPTTEEDEEFEQAFRSLMQGSMDSRKNIGRVNVDNMVIPTVVRTTTNHAHTRFTKDDGNMDGVRGGRENASLSTPSFHHPTTLMSQESSDDAFRADANAASSTLPAAAAAAQTNTRLRRAVPVGQTTFKVLRRGNKGKVEARELLVPEDSKLGRHSQLQEFNDKKEQSEMKRLVLQTMERDRDMMFYGGMDNDVDVDDDVVVRVKGPSTFRVEASKRWDAPAAAHTSWESTKEVEEEEEDEHSWMVQHQTLQFKPTYAKYASSGRGQGYATGGSTTSTTRTNTNGQGHPGHQGHGHYGGGGGGGGGGERRRGRGGSRSSFRGREGGSSSSSSSSSHHGAGRSSKG